MDSELIRFRVDPDLAQQAERACADLGFELRDVLRSVVARIAREHVLPFDLNTPGARDATRRPFYDYDERLWANVKPGIEAEVALALLTRYIADCSTRIDEAPQGGPAEPQLIKRLIKVRDDARAAKLNLNVSDAEAVQRVLDRFGPLVRAGTS